MKDFSTKMGSVPGKSGQIVTLLSSPPPGCFFFLVVTMASLAFWHALYQRPFPLLGGAGELPPGSGHSLLLCAPHTLLFSMSHLADLFWLQLPKLRHGLLSSCCETSSEPLWTTLYAPAAPRPFLTPPLPFSSLPRLVCTFLT